MPQTLGKDGNQSSLLMKMTEDSLLRRKRLLRQRRNWKIPIFGIRISANTPIMVVLGILWPHGPNFDQISQIPSFTSYLGQKDCTSQSKIVQFGKFKFLVLQDPQTQNRPTRAPMWPRNAKKGLNHPSPV